MRILHICWGLETTNGAANIARLIIGEQQSAGNEVEFVSKPTLSQLRAADQVWCHCGWYWVFWLVALYKSLITYHSSLFTLHFKPFTLYRMTECCYDPIRLRYHGWKKSLVGPIERWSLRQCDALVATCEAEAKWNRDYVGKKCPKVVVEDIKRFFDFNAEKRRNGGNDGNESEECRVKSEELRNSLNILYLGRPHPLKGTQYLEQAVRELNNSTTLHSSLFTLNLRMVSNHSGEELERDWEWCDVLCLPTLSDNFALVIAEALSRGKRVVTTDGAPAWEGQAGVIYIKGFVAANDSQRVSMLRDALSQAALRS